MNGKLNELIFKKKTLSNILEEIYNNHSKKTNQVSVLIDELKPLVNNIGDATLIVPLLKEYLDIGIKNDELLIKMAQLAQRTIQDGGGSKDDSVISKEELEQLLEESQKDLNKDDEQKQIE